jgi:multicomponent Na+:H+ antiporter subunit B
MTPKWRLAVFLLACAVVAPGVAGLALHMPRFGAPVLPLGDAINAHGTAQRHVSNMVSAVNFDYRGFDTLGEEFMLLCAVTGTVVLLRGARGEALDARPGIVPGRPILPRSEAVTLVARVFAPLIILFGVYVAAHAMTTPGGGFQGGVIMASGLLLVFLGDGYQAWRAVVKSRVLDACEGGGAALYALCGFAGMCLGLPFLSNFLPLGTAKEVVSGGLMLVENLGVTLAVGGGFSLIFLEFLEETRARKPDEPE